MIKILTTVLPVFFMIALGILANKKQLVTKEQAEGLNAVVSDILFPIMVFNAFFTADLKLSMIGVIAYVFVLHLAAMGIGALLSRFTGGKYAHVSRYLTATVDGGNICFPLYATIVGAQYISNIVLLDLAGMFIIFLVIPIMVQASSGEKKSVKELAKNVLKSPLIITLILAMICNFTGLYGLMEKAGIDGIYNAIVSMATGPIVAMILFIIGYRFEIHADGLAPLLKTALLRMVILGAGGFLMTFIFKDLCADKAFYIAVLLYFMCPPALVIPSILGPAMKSEDDKSFVSAFLSVYMIITLTAYVCIAAFIA